VRLAALILTVVAIAALATAGTATAAPVGGPVGNLALGKPTTASSWLAEGQPSLAVDGDFHTLWNAGSHPTQWIEVDLGARYAVGQMSLAVAQLPDGFTVHRVYVKAAADATYALLHEFLGPTADSQVLTLDLEPAAQDVRFVRIETTASPSWVAWREIEICSTACPKTMTLTSNTTLTEDHYGNILIHRDNVTLDCAGHTIHGPGVPGISGGVDVVLSSGVSVKNCVISQFAFANGIFATVGSNLRLQNNTLVGNAANGVHVDRMVDGVLIGNRSDSNAGYGIALTESRRMEVVHNLVERNGASGIALLEASNGNTVKANQAEANLNGFVAAGAARANVFADNVATANRQTGFILVEGARGNTFTNNQAKANGENGFTVFASNENTLKANHAEANLNGFVAAGAASANTFADNLAKANRESGLILVEGASGNTFTNNRAQANGGNGFTVDASNGNTFGTNAAFDNGADGIWLQAVERSELAGNQVQHNRRSGIVLVETTRSRLIGNLVSENGNYGLEVQSSNGNDLIGNDVRSHPSDGIAIFFSRNNVVVDNRSIGNVWGIGLYSSNLHLVAGNVVTHSREHGILLLDDSTGNHVERNNVVQSGLVGFLLGGGHGNTLTGNIANQNGDEGFVFTAGSNGNVVSENRSITNRVGFSLQDGAAGNTLTRNVAQANADVDAEDQNATAGSNNWLSNTFGTTSGF
jgi:parallel beta-helix repeat protein